MTTKQACPNSRNAGPDRFYVGVFVSDSAL